MAQLRRAQVKRQCLALVALDAASGGQQVRVVVHPPVKSCGGGRAEVSGGSRQVDRAAPTLFQAAAEHVPGHGIATLGGDLEPGARQCGVLLDALAVQENLAEQRLCFGQAIPGGIQDGAGRLARVAGQAFAQLFAAQGFGAGQGEAHA
ncbi:hypothetical protein D3C84_984920 [compost metagenome]